LLQSQQSSSLLLPSTTITHLKKSVKSETQKKIMGAKASTANGGQSPRTFSNSSSSDVVSAGNSSTSFNFLRAIHGVEVANDSRQRARSLSAVPDIQSSSTANHHHHHHQHHHQNTYSSHLNSQQQYNDNVGFPNVGAGGHHFEISSSNTPDQDSSSHDDANNPMHAAVSALSLGRVYTATSLPSHIWSLNGEQLIPFLK